MSSGLDAKVRDILVRKRVVLDFMSLGARPAGFEPATRGLEVRCSVLLSYGRNEQKCCKAAHFSGDSNTPRCLMAAVGQQ